MNDINSYIQAFTEVKCILDFLPMQYTENLPKELLNIIKIMYDEKYKVDINPSIELKKQNFIEDTKNLMAVLKYNYWCEDENEKKYLKKCLKIMNISIKKN